jgi:hypothetical protein
MQIFKSCAEPWQVHVNVLVQFLDPFTAKSLTNDLAWVTAEAEKLNRAAESAAAAQAARPVLADALAKGAKAARDAARRHATDAVLAEAAERWFPDLFESEAK